MARWLICDSLYCPEQFFCSHLSSYSHFLSEAGEDVTSVSLNMPLPFARDNITLRKNGPVDVLFLLDQYSEHQWVDAMVKIAQVAAICSPMPWEVRKADGSPAYSLVISSLRWMVEEARRAGCRAEWMPLAFDTRARVCGMGVERTKDCIFIGTTGPNHQRRTRLLSELSDIVEVITPVFGREYFKTLASAKVVLNVHAEWARGEANNMRLFESVGLGCHVVSDGARNHDGASWWWTPEDENSVSSWRRAIQDALVLVPWKDQGHVLKHETYKSRIPRLIELARSL